MFARENISNSYFTHGVDITKKKSGQRFSRGPDYIARNTYSRLTGDRCSHWREVPTDGWPLLWHRTKLCEEGHHVEVMAAFPDLLSLEFQNPAGRCRLTLPGSWNSASRPYEGTGLSPLPGHLHRHSVAAGNAVRNSSLDVRHGLLPALHRPKNIFRPYKSPLRSEFVVNRARG